MINLGVRVDEIPAIVFFSDPKERNDIYILKLSEIINESDEYDEESINKIFNKIAAIIDDICTSNAKCIDRVSILQSVCNTNLATRNPHSSDSSDMHEVLRKTSSTATSVFAAIVKAVEASKLIFGIFA